MGDGPSKGCCHRLNRADLVNQVLFHVLRSFALDGPAAEAPQIQETGVGADPNTSCLGHFDGAMHDQWVTTMKTAGDIGRGDNIEHRRIVADFIDAETLTHIAIEIDRMCHVSLPAGGAHAVYPLELKESGYVPEAVVNWLSLMGWSYDDRTEFFIMPDLIGKFSLAKLNPSPAAVNFSKLDHFNGLHIRSLKQEDLASRLVPRFRAADLEVTEDELRPITPLIQERIRTLDEAVEMSGFFFRNTVQPDPQQLIGKNMSPVESAAALSRSIDLIQGFERLAAESLELALRGLADDLNLKVGQLFGILRVAVTGQRVSPPLIETMEILGKELILQRLHRAAELLESPE